MKITNKTFGKISLNVVLLGIVSFIADVSSEIIAPILPLFIASLGGSGIAIGLVGGLRDSIASILNAVSGYWSDKIGKRKIFVVYGYLTSSVFKGFLALSNAWQHVLLFAGMERIGKGLRGAPRDAIISESMPENKGLAFGFHRAFDTAVAIAGSVLALILFWSFGLGFKQLIVIAAALAFVSLIPLYFVKEGKKTEKADAFKISLKELPTRLKIFILIAAVFAFANFNYMFFILKAQEAFAGKLSIAVPILLYVLFNIFYAFSSIPFGVLSDGIGRKKALILGYALFSLTSFGFIFFDSIIGFIVLFALYGVTYAAIDGNQRAFVSDLSPQSLRATSLGVFHTIVGLIALPASLIAGFLWEIFSPSIIFLYSGLVSFAAIALFLWLGRHFKHSVNAKSIESD